ncbi:MAG: HD domain-containing protein [Candidatus Caenarcaniphilales bacterium]|nr:HD domain-containing protein [Candidatus Caenarcaniphilales bacterium]
MKKEKKYTFLDPIHQNIELDTAKDDEKLILSLIETSEFQRLRRIRQLGFSYLTFYGAESTRFVHSIGAFHIARMILNKLERNHRRLIENHRLPILIAALLHDIGHGPFSHSSEPAFDFQHEKWTVKIILDQSTQINQLLSNYEKDLPQKVAKILSESNKPSWTCQIISGQLDCDRADYLIRDSHQTGTTYGVFQLDRIIQSLELEKVKGEVKLVVNEKGINAVEDYLFARYSMYLQVYHHKKTLSADALFSSLIERAKDLLINEEPIELSDSLKVWLLPTKYKMRHEDFWEVDDVCIIQHLKSWKKRAKDYILQDLASRLLDRNLFQSVRVDTIRKKDIENVVYKLGLEKSKYYCLIRECKEFQYGDKKKPILVEKNGKVKELSKVSSVAAALINKSKELDIEWMFYPKDLIRF